MLSHLFQLMTVVQAQRFHAQAFLRQILFREAFRAKSILARSGLPSTTHKQDSTLATVGAESVVTAVDHAAEVEVVAECGGVSANGESTTDRGCGNY